MIQEPITGRIERHTGQAYPSYKPSGVDWLRDVPAHWQMRRLCTIASITTGGMDTIDKQDDGQYPLYVRSQTVERTNNWSFDGEAVLTAGDGVGVGRVFHYANGKFDYHQRVYKFSDFRDALARFFFLYLKATLRFEVMRGTAKATVDSLRLPMLRNIPISLPPYGEQAAIIRFLDHADERIQRYISAKQELIALLEERKQAIVNQVITGQIDVRTGSPYGTYKDGQSRWLKQVPKHWDVRAAKWHFREVDERSETGSEELLSVSHITGVTPRKEKNVTMFMAESNIGDKLCQPGDIVVNTMWAWMAALGVATQTGIVSPSYAVYRPHEHAKLLPGYTELLLRSTPYRSEYNCQSTGIRASRLRLYPEQFLRIRLLCPPVDEQRAIIEFAEKTTETIRRSMDVTRKQLSRIAEFHTRIVADVVTGKVDVRSATAWLPEDDFDETKDQRVDGVRNDGTPYPNERKTGVSDCET